MKKENIYGYIFALVIYLRLILEKKNALKSNFSEFIRGNLHNIYGEDRDLLVYHVILLICLYVAFYTVSIRMISLEIDNFRNIVCFKSKGIFQLFKITICFFSKKFIIDSCAMMIVISIGYMFIENDYIFMNYMSGLIDLIKLPIIMLLATLICVVFKFNKVMMFCIFYFSILIYIVFVNSLSLSIVVIYSGAIALIVLAVIVIIFNSWEV